MNKLIKRFSNYAISKKHTLNILGGAIGGNYVCAACGGGYVRCPHACIHVTCSYKVFGFECGSLSTGAI
ncbi:MAG: hypothetical protein AAGA77_19775 [Bacteroidota bacterium]